MASTSSRRRQWKYDVFLSFRGEDTRDGFTAFLYSALTQRGILTFMDDAELEKGKSIRPELLAAIEQSRSAIVILSWRYAYSSWCLDELVKIIQCMKEMGQQVLPVFFRVDPSDVRHQRRWFELQWEPEVDVEVREHEEVYRKSEDRLNAWRAALTEVANLSGWHSKNDQEVSFLHTTHTLICLLAKVDKLNYSFESRIISSF
ncbi:TMV resistance protein N [Rosa sericea]